MTSENRRGCSVVRAVSSSLVAQGFEDLLKRKRHSRAGLWFSLARIIRFKSPITNEPEELEKRLSGWSTQYSHEMGVTCSTHNKVSTPHPLVSPAPRVPETGLLGLPALPGRNRQSDKGYLMPSDLPQYRRSQRHTWTDGWAPLVPHMRRVRDYLMTRCNVLGEVVEEQEI